MIVSELKQGITFSLILAPSSSGLRGLLPHNPLSPPLLRGIKGVVGTIGKRIRSNARPCFNIAGGVDG